MSGTKYDSNKPRITLVPSEAIIAAARAMTYGAKKYNDDNFKSGLAHRRVLDAAFRHLLAYSAGEDIDAESGLNHIDSALASLCMLAYLQVHKPELDDRYKGGSNE